MLRWENRRRENIDQLPSSPGGSGGWVCGDWELRRTFPASERYTIEWITYMQTFQEIRIRVRTALLGRIPELLLGRVSVHGTYLNETVPELFRWIVEVARLGTDDSAVVHQAGKMRDRERRM